MKAWIKIRALYRDTGGEEREMLTERLLIEIPQTYIEAIEKDFSLEPPRVRNDGFEAYLLDSLNNDFVIDVGSVEK